MSDSQRTSDSRWRAWNEDGRLYLIVGAITAVLALFILPVAGLVAIYCGYHLYVEFDRTVAGFLVAVSGGFGFVYWVWFLSTQV